MIVDLGPFSVDLGSAGLCIICATGFVIAGLLVYAVVWTTAMRKRRREYEALAQATGLRLEDHFPSRYQLSGTYRSRPVATWEWSHGRHAWRLCVEFGVQNPSGLAAQLLPRPRPLGIFRRDGMQEISTGDSAFDQQVIAQSQPAGALAGALADGSLRQQISQSLLPAGTIEVKGTSLIYTHVAGWSRAKLERARTALDVMCSLADALRL